MTDSDNNNDAGANSKFTTREIELLGYAMQSLKSGPPEIDYENLAKLAGMTNPKSAANAWGKIKNKLLTPDGADKPIALPKTPKKGRGAKAKVDKAVNGDNAEDDNDAGNGEKATPKKTPRKRATKAKDDEGSPKKRGRKAKKEDEKPAVKEEIKEEIKEEEVKDEPMDSSQEAAGSDDGSALTEPVEDDQEEV